MAAVGGWRYARASAPVSGPIILLSAIVSSMALGRETGIAQGFASFDDRMDETDDQEPLDGALDTGVGPMLRDGESSERAAAVH